MVEKWINKYINKWGEMTEKKTRPFSKVSPSIAVIKNSINRNCFF